MSQNVTKDVTKELTDRHKFILNLLREDCTLSTQRITQKIAQKESISERTIKRDLAALHEIGILFREGGRKNGYWLIKNINKHN